MFTNWDRAIIASVPCHHVTWCLWWIIWLLLYAGSSAIAASSYTRAVLWTPIVSRLYDITTGPMWICIRIRCMHMACPPFADPCYCRWNWTNMYNPIHWFNVNDCTHVMKHLMFTAWLVYAYLHEQMCTFVVNAFNVHFTMMTQPGFNKMLRTNAHKCFRGVANYWNAITLFMLLFALKARDPSLPHFVCNMLRDRT